MADESDGIEEALESTVRLAAMAGARLGSEIARAHEERLREQRRVDERDAAQLAQRFEAEKRAAVAELSQVHRADWWERADPERIGQTYATARAWAPEAAEAAEAAHAEQTMRQQLRERYGVDLDRTDPRTVSREVDAWQQRLEQQRRQEADRERTTETSERAEAAMLLDQAAREDRRAGAARQNERETGDLPAEDVAEFVAGARERRNEDVSVDSVEGIRARADELYDCADRRTAEVRSLEARGIDPGVAQNRMHADAGAGTPATLATRASGRSRAPRARKTLGRGTQAERAGVER